MNQSSPQNPSASGTNQRVRNVVLWFAATLAIIVYLAHWLANRGPLVGTVRKGFIPFLIIALPVIGLVFKEPDLGTTGVLAATAFTMWFIAGANVIHLGLMMSSAAVAMIVVGLRGYQLDRIRIWQNPWLDPLGEGFHTVQGLMALGLSVLFGVVRVVNLAHGEMMTNAM